ncbi:hypothetical protein [Phormidesmis priestleyi]
MSVIFRNFFPKVNVIYLLLGMVLTASLLSCGGDDRNSAGNWVTYRNDRFGFEFLHPDRWFASIAPENRDGMAFSDPTNPNVEIRGWAGTDLGGQKKLAPSNFTTQQGILGNLEIKLDAKVSSMTMTIVQNKIRYNWQGSAPSQQFAGYYQFFYYIASRFKISGNPK